MIGIALIFLTFLYFITRAPTLYTVKDCSIHKWSWTTPQPGAKSIMKCETCSLIFGPEDEWGKPNPKWKGR